MKILWLVLGLGLVGPARAQEDDVRVSPEIAAVIRGGLQYLAMQQSPNGSWTQPGRDSWTTGITGYALLAFVATGNLPNEGEYGKVAAAAKQFLLDSLQNDGIFAPVGPQYMYGHGIATLVLSELYGQTKAATLRPRLERAVQVIIRSQNGAGGWRYQPVAGDADMSVTVLQALALRAAKEAGLDVPQATLDNAVEYIHSCYEPRTGGFKYQPRGAESFACTAAAVYSLQVLGRHADPQVASGAEHLTQLFERKTPYNAYGIFYANPAKYLLGGPAWNKWYTELSAELVKSVRRQGDLLYWENEDVLGRTYCTAVHTIILALPYHYLPLYQR